MSAKNEQMLDLLAARATEGLAPEEQRELEALLREAPGADPVDLDLAAAAATNAFALQSGRGADAPVDLKSRLLAAAERHFDERAHPASVTNLADERARRAAREGEQPAQPSLGVFNRLGWAAAAVLLVALIVVNRPLPEDAPTDPATARAELMREAPGTVVAPWNPPDIQGYEAVSGDVVWNNTEQEGYLRLAGMPVNDPAVAQYQLWIVDPARDSRPVDGGVFDIPAGPEEVIIPIRAKLGIIDPDAFAITLEQPGGVVVSDGPLLVVASTG